LFDQWSRPNSAKGAQYDSQGQARSEAERVAPGKIIKLATSPERAKYSAVYFGLSGLARFFRGITMGDVLRFAPHLPLAVIFRTFGAVCVLLLSLFSVCLV
jgi:hypothetical protein